MNQIAIDDIKRLEIHLTVTFEFDSEKLIVRHHMTQNFKAFNYHVMSIISQNESKNENYQEARLFVKNLIEQKYMMRDRIESESWLLRTILAE